MAGILFENKCDHTTFFGNNIEWIQGIHMIPLLPPSTVVRPADFVRQEWDTYFSSGRADKIDPAWRGIIYGNYATVDPHAAWEFFNRKDFDPSWLDGGASLTWYMAYAAGELRLFHVFASSSRREPHTDGLGLDSSWRGLTRNVSRCRIVLTSLRRGEGERRVGFPGLDVLGWAALVDPSFGCYADLPSRPVATRDCISTSLAAHTYVARH